MSDEFSQQMRHFFGADEGAFSVITKDEFKKSQVTFVGPEQELAERHFGDVLAKRHGSIAEISKVVDDPNLYYRMFPTGEKVGLTTSYKTGKPNELRLYLRTAEFKPDPDDYWGVFTRDGDIWLCEFSAILLEQIEAGQYEDLAIRDDLLDDDSGEYQIALNEKPEKKETSSGGYVRSTEAARKALELAGFECEIHPEFPTFVSERTGNPFMEAHHLIPMSMQKFFEYSLDISENICCLNPLSHRMLHHAKFSQIEENLSALIRSRRNLLDAFGLLERDVLAMYAR